MKLTIKECYIVNVCSYPGEPATTRTLKIAGLLTPSLAEQLGIRGGCYAEKDGAAIPLPLAGYPKPALTINGADIRLGGQEFRAMRLQAFQVLEPKSKGEKGVCLEISVSIQFAKKEPIIQWADKTNKDRFEMTVAARQEDMFVKGNEVTSDANEGEQTGGSKCGWCEMGMPFGDVAIDTHENGKKCKDLELVARRRDTSKAADPQFEAAKPEPAVAAAAADGPALAPAAAVGAPTHRKADKRQPRNPEAERAAQRKGQADPEAEVIQ